MPFALQAELARAAAKITLVLALGSALYGQASVDPSATLSRARIKISATMRRLPKYACVQTIDRSYYTRLAASNAASNSSAASPACGQLNGDAKAEPKKGRPALRLDSTDRVRMDVAQGNSQEIHSWPGASHFNSGYLDELVERGPIASGSFGGYLVDVFDNSGAEFHFLGENTEGGRRIFEYGYRVPQKISHYHVGADGPAWIVTGYEGSFAIDADSLDLLRLKVRTEELPAETHLCQAESALEYASVRIGNGDFLLPRRSDLHLVQRNTRETTSTAVFTGCREFQAESVLHFDEDSSVPGPAGGSKSAAPIALPEGIAFTLRLSGALDSETAAVGDLVDATVTQAVRESKSKAILIPAGAVAHGRISRMEHRLIAPTAFTFGIAWHSMEINGVASPLAANVDRSTELLMASLTRQSVLRRMFVQVPPDSLYFPIDAKKHVVKSGYEMRWLTAAPPQPKAAEGK
jgi:hypothetical protein